MLPDIIQICTQMTYHEFLNLGELIQGSFVIKLRKGLASKYLFNRDWNCKYTTKVNGKCAYKVEFHECCIFQKVPYRGCGGFIL